MMAENVAPSSFGRTGQVLSWKPGSPELPYSSHDRLIYTPHNSAGPPAVSPCEHHYFQMKSSASRGYIPHAIHCK